MNNTYLFLDLYKTLEQTIINTYNLNKNEPPINYLMNIKAYKSYKDELDYCREVRNFLSHEPKIDKEFAIIPSDEMIKLIKSLINMVSASPNISKIMKNIDNIFYANENDYVLSSLKKLTHKKYTHIPIIKNNKIIGVLSKDSIFNYLIDNDFEKINNNLKFIDIKDYTKLDESKYLFVRKDVTIDQVIYDVEKRLSKGDRIAYIFITTDGMKDGNVLGLVTPLDLLAY